MKIECIEKAAVDVATIESGMGEQIHEKEIYLPLKQYIMQIAQMQAQGRDTLLQRRHCEEGGGNNGRATWHYALLL